MPSSSMPSHTADVRSVPLYLTAWRDQSALAIWFIHQLQARFTLPISHRLNVVVTKLNGEENLANESHIKDFLELNQACQVTEVNTRSTIWQIVVIIIKSSGSIRIHCVRYYLLISTLIQSPKIYRQRITLSAKPCISSKRHQRRHWRS